MEAGTLAVTAGPSFDTAKLDGLMEEAGLDALIVSSRHNVRYLLGSYSLFFEHFDAHAVDRFVPVVGYVRGSLEQAFVAMSPLDGHHFEVATPWTPTVAKSTWGTLDTAQLVASLLESRGLAGAVVGIEERFAPLAFARELARALPGARFIDVAELMDDLRAVKRPEELALLRDVSDAIVDAMFETVQAATPGVTTRELHDRLAAAEVARGLGFEYCLITAGTSMNRAPSDARWERGGALSLDSGGTLHGYLGDLTRMASLGEPSARMREVLAEVEAVQRAARGAIRPGVTGRQVYEAALAAQAQGPDAKVTSFIAHGVGLVTHETPRMGDGPIPYATPHRDRPLEAGMVVSVETDIRAPDVGFVKLEDTVAVTEDGYEAYGDQHRDWIVVPC